MNIAKTSTLVLNAAKSLTGLISAVLIFLVAMVPALVARVWGVRGTGKRVLLAGVETSANLREIAACLAQDPEYSVSLAEFYSNRFYSHSDYDLPRHGVRVIELFSAQETPIFRSSGRSTRETFRVVSMAMFVFNVLFSYDVVFFNWTKSFLPWNLDYLLMRIAGIQLVIRHCGDDVRYRPLQNGIHKSFGVSQWAGSKRSMVQVWVKFARQCWAELNGIVLSSRDHATFQVGRLLARPYVQRPLPRTTGFNFANPLVLHAPSDPRIKGTQIVEEAVNILKKQGLKFEFLILSDAPHEQVLSALGRTAVLVDQPGAVPARLAVEGMASGCAVIGGNIPEIHGLKNLPVVPFVADSLDLARKLRALLLDLEGAKVLGDEAYLYAVENFSQASFRRYFSELTRGVYSTFLPISNNEDLLSSSAELLSEKSVLRIMKWIRLWLSKVNV